MDKDSLLSISNLINLKDLNNASILHNLRKRFKEVSAYVRGTQDIFTLEMVLLIG